jgi:hypothetical protein
VIDQGVQVITVNMAKHDGFGQLGICRPSL